MATYKSIRYNVDYQGNAGSLMPLSLFTSDGSDATASFTSKIDSTYDSYLFIFNSIHPETDAQRFSFNVSTDTGSNYNIAKTTTQFTSYHTEAGGSELAYATADDLAQGTGVQYLTAGVGNGSDECCSGCLRLFNPSSTTFVKHFVSHVHHYHKDNIADSIFAAGYVSTTSAVDAIQFSFASGEIQAGTIGMFGVQ